MKKTTLCLAAVVAGASYVSAQEVSITSTFAWESSYMFRGVQLAEDYFAPSVDISYGGFYTGVWAALPVDHIYDNEVDLYAGYSFPMSDVLSADVGATYYTYPDSQDDFFDSDTNTLEFYGGVAMDVQLSPAVYVYYDVELENLTLETSIGHSFPIDDASSVDVSAHLGWVDLGDDVVIMRGEGEVLESWSDYIYYGAGVSYNYQVNDAVGLSLFANWAASSEDQVDDMTDDNELWFGFSITAGM
ncbi:MAG: hypothetical protein GVY10_07270 [Verrucomicrobia bacterium]|jgi:uncharacterized protein (TIGR02001 family)|nr:hypothetical protein [Verrucomicrobiota bacterium]